LTESITLPSKVIVRGYERWNVWLRSGNTVFGRLMQDGPDAVCVLAETASGVPELITIPRRDIAVDDQGRPRMQASTVSAMPDNLLSDTEVKAMVTFLRTL
jgi:hypothetical protein